MTATLSPGWYQDPNGLPTLRWWNGGQWTEQLAPLTPQQVTYPTQHPPVRTSTASAQATVKYLVAGVLFIASGAVISLLTPIAWLCVPLAIICFMRAATLKTCGSCRKDVPRSARTCTSCHAEFAVAVHAR